MEARRRHMPLHIHIGYLATLLIVVVGGGLGLYYLDALQRQMILSSETLFERTGAQAAVAFRELEAPATQLAGLLAASPLSEARTPEQRERFLPLLANALETSRQVNAVYLAWDNGDFFLLRRYDPKQEKVPAGGVDGARYLLQTIDHRGGVRRQFVYLDAALKQVARQARPDYAYDPRERDWYRQALGARGVVRSPPYVFFSTREPGITYARDSGRQMVAGVDVHLSALAAGLEVERVAIAPHAQVVLVQGDGRVVAYPDLPAAVRMRDAELSLVRLGELRHPALTALAADWQGRAYHVTRLDVGGMAWRGGVERISGDDAQPLFLAVAAPEHELLASAQGVARQGRWMTLLFMLMMIPLGWMMSRFISRPLRRLVHAVEAIEHLDFQQTLPPESYVSEISQLRHGITRMRETIRHFIGLSRALSAEPELDKLLRLVLEEAISACDGTGGAIYLRSDDENSLQPVCAQTAEGTARQLMTVAVGSNHPVAQALNPGAANSQRLPADSELLEAALLAPGLNAAHTEVITLVLRNDAGWVVGVLLLCSRLNADVQLQRHLSYLQALSGMAAVAIEKHQLLNGQRALMKALIELVAEAIDAKSAYTSGHCQRVPLLAEMLAHAAVDTGSGPFADFRLDAHGWEALHLAAWLHDCGKVTTPEYVVDKATKLETIYNRIHEIRMRFEVLKREVEVHCWQKIAEGGAREELLAALANVQHTLDDEFAFVARCNIGGESMSDEAQARLQRIAGHTWTRTLDDRLGLSHEDAQRKAREPSPVLPVKEHLLADKPEHVVTRPAQEQIAPDNRWGFRMDVPELLYNRGELYNLCVRRGTLNAEERFKINAHIIETIKMLHALPFPRHLRNVPEIAGGHHERMDGQGYPRRLRGEQMSVLARIMAIADVFEALTARDRPYKEGMPLSQSLAIMQRMAGEGHLDPDLYTLFLEAGVWRNYASDRLAAAQCDVSDIAAYRLAV